MTDIEAIWRQMIAASYEFKYGHEPTGKTITDCISANKIGDAWEIERICAQAAYDALVGDGVVVPREPSEETGWTSDQQILRNTRIPEAPANDGGNDG